MVNAVFTSNFPALSTSLVDPRSRKPVTRGPCAEGDRNEPESLGDRGSGRGVGYHLPAVRLDEPELRRGRRGRQGDPTRRGPRRPQNATTAPHRWGAVAVCVALRLCAPDQRYCWIRVVRRPGMPQRWGAVVAFR